MIHSTKYDRISITFLEMYANVRDIPRNIVECRYWYAVHFTFMQQIRMAATFLGI
jgi:hypothetical protein